MTYQCSHFLFLLFTVLNLTLSAPPISRSDICPVRLPDPPSNQDVTPPQIDTSSVRQPRIINGDLVSENLLPYIAYLFADFSNTSSIYSNASCTGTLISPQWVLTAAHCVKGIERDLVVYTGLRKAEKVPLPKPYLIEEFFVHQKFDGRPQLLPETLNFDIAVLRLATPAQGKFMPVNVDRSVPVPEQYVRSVGYGLSRHVCDIDTQDVDEPIELPKEAGLLRQVDVPIVDHCECWRRYEDKGANVRINLTNILCTGYKERTCAVSFGDSGGPLVHYQNGGPVVIGVASFAGVCAFDNLPGGYVRTSSFEDWLDGVGAEFTKVSGGGALEILSDCEELENADALRDVLLIIVLPIVSGGVVALLVALLACNHMRRRRRREAAAAQAEEQYNQILEVHADGSDPNSRVSIV